MTSDTYTKFQQPQRGLFGDNEHADTRNRVSGASDLVDLTLILRMEKPLAIAVSQDTGASAKWIWLAKSRIEFIPKGKGRVEVTMPEALAIEKGLV